MSETMSDYGQYTAERDAKLDQIELGKPVELVDGRRLVARDKRYARGLVLLSDGQWHWVEEVA